MPKQRLLSFLLIVIISYTRNVYYQIYISMTIISLSSIATVPFILLNVNLPFPRNLFGSLSRSSKASCTPVDAPDGTAARNCPTIKKYNVFCKINSHKPRGPLNFELIIKWIGRSIATLHWLHCAWLPSLWTGMRLWVILLWYKPCYFSNANYFPWYHAN